MPVRVTGGGQPGPGAETPAEGGSIPMKKGERRESQGHRCVLPESGQPRHPLAALRAEVFRHVAGRPRERESERAREQRRKEAELFPHFLFMRIVFVTATLLLEIYAKAR